MLKFISRKFIYIVFLVLCNVLWAQDHDFVKLIEEKNGKRLDLYAVNTGTISYQVFLQVKTEDFRRSSLRPVLQSVPPNSKTKLITIIQLDNTEGNYEKIFIVNEVSYEFDLRKDRQELQNKVSEVIDNRQFILFTETDCDFCEEAKSILERNYLKYIEYNISEDTAGAELLLNTLKAHKIDSKAKLPILQIEDSIYTDLNNNDQLIANLQKHY